MSDLKQHLRSEWERVTGEFPVLDAGRIIRESAAGASLAAESRPRRKWSIAIVAAVAASILIGGPLLLLRGGGTSSAGDDSAVTVSAISAPASAPQPGAPATTLPATTNGSAAVVSSDLGDFTWTRISVADDSEFPGLQNVVAADWGFVAVEDGLLWQSADGISWSKAVLPVGLARAEDPMAEQGAVVLSGIDDEGRVGLWRSEDGGEWLRVGLADIPPRPVLPAVDGAEWEWSGWSDPRRVGRSIVMRGSAEVRLDLGHAESYASWDPDASVLRIIAIPSESTVATYTIAVEEIDEAISIRATERGSGQSTEVTISRSGVDSAVLVERMLAGSLTLDFVAATKGEGEVEVMVAPWSRPEAYTDVEIRTVDDGVIADVHFFTAYPSTFVTSVGGRERWLSGDGISWVPGDPLFGSREDIDLIHGNGRYVARQSGLGRAWLSVDGVEWLETAVPGIRPDMVSTLPAAFGWVAWGMEDVGAGSEALVVWITPEGRLWERIDLSSLDIGMPPAAGTFALTAAGNTLFVDRQLDTSRMRTVWVGELESDL